MSAWLASATNLHLVVRVTGNFTSERPLSESVKEVLAAAFDQGWADPRKLSQSSRKASILRDQALDSIAANLTIPRDSIEVLGEPNLAPYLAISGFLQPSDTFIYSAIDKGKIRAIARSHKGSTLQLDVDSQGKFLPPTGLTNSGVLSLQLANGETGGTIDAESFAESARAIICDATTLPKFLPLPSHWSAAFFDASSWYGPSGLSILAIKDRRGFKYPLPHIAPISSPGSYSLPLLLASAAALENFSYDHNHLMELRLSLTQMLAPISSIVIVETDGLPHLVSLIVDGVAAEQLVRALSERRIDIDAGSACNPEDLHPSHVIAAMGYKTNGHIRLTLHQDTTEDELSNLARNLTEVIDELRD